MRSGTFLVYDLEIALFGFDDSRTPNKDVNDAFEPQTLNLGHRDFECSA